MRKHHTGFQHGARFRNHGHFHTGTDTGIKTNHALVPRGCGKQQILEVCAENADRFFLSFIPKPRKKLCFQGCKALHAPRPADHGRNPLICRTPLVMPAEKIRNQFLTGMYRQRFLFFRQKHLERENPLLTASEKGQGTVGSNLI